MMGPKNKMMGLMRTEKIIQFCCKNRANIIEQTYGVLRTAMRNGNSVMN